MGISSAELIDYYPNLYHMAEENTWESIREYGLLSTSALLDLYGVEGDLRNSIESRHRPESVVIESNKYGSATIRDQKPLRESALEDCLVDTTPKKWYEILNSRVFFWLTEKRLLTLLSARAYRNKIHCVLTIDTEQLLNRYVDRVKLSSINSGSTIYRPVKRGNNTFLSPSEYPFEERKRLRGIGNAIAELTVEYSVPDIAEFTLNVAHMRGENVIETIYERPE